MNYIELNNRHQAKMRGIIALDSETEFEWVDKNLDNAFLRIIPEIRNTIKNRELTTVFNSLIHQFNHKTIDTESFLQRIDALTKDVALPYNMTIQYYNTIISEQESMLISGIGGIGIPHEPERHALDLMDYMIHKAVGVPCGIQRPKMQDTGFLKILQRIPVPFVIEVHTVIVHRVDRVNSAAGENLTVFGRCNQIVGLQRIFRLIVIAEHHFQIGHCQVIRFKIGAYSLKEPVKSMFLHLTGEA